MALRKIKSEGLFYRNYIIDKRSINQEERTVELTFSSETRQVERYYGIEILDHSPGAVRLDRMKAAGPLLFLHDMSMHIGVCEDISIEKRRGKAVMRFGRSALAEEKFQDVIDGVLVNVSVGYRVYKMVLEETGADGQPNVYRAIDWEPYEISLLPVAADISVGVGRAAGESFEIEIEERMMDEDDVTTQGGADNTRGVNTQAQPANPAQPVDRVTVANEARDAERRRVADITSMGDRYEQYGAREMVQEYINGGKTVDDFRRALLEKLPREQNAGSGDAPTNLDMEARDVKRYSLIKAVRAVVAAKDGDMTLMKEAAFEMECSREIADRMDREAKGFYVPMDVVMRARMMQNLEQRALNATTGADLIALEHMDSMFIEALRPNSVVMQLGATVLDGLVGDLSIPRELLTPSFYWTGDDETPPESESTFGSVKFSPKTIAGAVPMSRRLLKQSAPSVERLVERAMLKGSALALDIGALAGTGTNNQPLGVENVTGINTQAVATPGNPTWTEVVGFETAVGADDALQGKLAYATTPTVRGNMKTKVKDAGSGRFVLENNEANGYSVATSSQLAANRILFGNWEDLVIGLWGVIDINPDTAAKAASGGLVLRMFQDADVAVGHAQSFCKNA